MPSSVALSAKRLAGLDVLGAVVSFACLGLIIPSLQTYFGMQAQAWYLLAAIAAVLLAHSLYCYLSQRTDHRALLRIAISNLAYMAVSTLILCLFWNELTFWGRGYLLLEKVILAGIVFVEWRYFHTHQFVAS